MLDITHTYVDVETEFGVVSLILIFLWKFTSKIIFGILQVSRDRKRLFTASVRHLSRVVYCKKVAFLKQWSLTAAHVTTVQPWLVSCKNVEQFALM